jgi:hypothetical protein
MPLREGDILVGGSDFDTAHVRGRPARLEEE